MSKSSVGDDCKISAQCPGSSLKLSRWGFAVVGVLAICGICWVLPREMVWSDESGLLYARSIAHTDRELSRMLSYVNDTGRLNGATNLLQLVPLPFLPNYRNPCWLGAFPQTDPTPRHSQVLKVLDKERINKYTLKFEMRTLLGTTSLVHCLPYFLLAGQPKCGTTDLYRKLVGHPSIASAIMKEPHWWTRRRFDDELKFSFYDYADFFSIAADEIHRKHNAVNYHSFVTGEASASTLWDMTYYHNLPGNFGLDEPRFLNAHYIKLLIPNVKIIVILRNPVDRLYSDYLYFHKNVNKSAKLFHSKVVSSIDSFTECMRTHSHRACVYSNKSKTQVRLHVGLYYVFINDWLKVFDRRQMMIVRLEDYSADRLATLNKLWNFLELEPFTGEEAKQVAEMPTANTARNRTKKVGQMLAKTRTLLESFYAPSNRRLAALLKNRSYLWN